MGWDLGLRAIWVFRGQIRTVHFRTVYQLLGRVAT